VSQLTHQRRLPTSMKSCVRNRPLGAVMLHP
jgi:hypothetical protein